MNAQINKKEPNILKGSVYALIAFFCMAVFGIFTKIGLQGGSVYWISFIVYLTGTLVLAPYIAVKGLSYLKSEHYPALISRAIFGTLASFCYTLSIHYIPIVNGTLLFNTAPIFIPLLSMIFLKETITKGIWWAVLLGFIGIIIIIKPTSEIFTQVGNLVGVFSGISLAIAYLLMKKLTSSDPGARIIFYYLGIGTLIQIPLLFLSEGLPSPISCLYAILGGIFLVVAQLSLVKGYQYAQASQIGIYQYSTVVFVSFFDWLLWNVSPPLSDILGIVLVALAGIEIIRSGVHGHLVIHPEEK